MRSNAIKHGPARAPARAMLRATGLDDAAIARPLVAVVHTWSDVSPCNLTLRDLAQYVRAGVEGYEGVVVSHQLPIWTLRRSIQGERLWHHPRRRECSLASVTTVLFHGVLPVRVMYAEPAAHLLAAAVDVTGTAEPVAP